MSQTSGSPWPLSAPQLLELMARAHATLQLTWGRSSFGLIDEKDKSEHEGAYAALYLGQRVCAQLGGHGLATAFTEATLELSRIEDDSGGLDLLGCQAITRYVRQLGVDGPLAPLAGAESSDVRQAVAAGLDVTRAKELELLHAYFASTDGSLSAAARKALEQAGKSTWWLGRFASDPSSEIEGDDDAPARTRAWAGAVELIGAYPRAKEASLVRLLKRLPPSLRSSAAEAVLNNAVVHDRRGLARECLETEGGRRALQAGILKGESEWSQRWQIGKVVEQCSEGARRAIANVQLELFERGTSAEWADWQNQLGRSSAVLTAAWDPSWSLDRLMAMLLRSDLPDYSPHLNDLEACISASHAIGPWQARFEQLLLTGFPDVQTQVGRCITKALDELPAEQLRDLTERALRSTRDSTRTWALTHLIGDAYSRKRDGTRAQLLARLCKDPALEKLILADATLTRRALRELRPELLEPRLTLMQRTHLMLAIGRLNQGLNPLTSFSGWLDLSRKSMSARQRDEALEAGRKDAARWSRRHFGPFTTEEWACFRRYRNAVPFGEERELDLVIAVLPPEPDRDDRDYVERLVAHVLEVPSERMVTIAAFAGLLCFRRVEDVPKLRQVAQLNDYLQKYATDALDALYGPTDSIERKRADDEANDW